MAPLSSLVELLQDLGHPAFVANADGTILCGNKAFSSALRVSEPPSSCGLLTPEVKRQELLSAWANGTSSLAKFTVEFAEENGARKWQLHVAPITQAEVAKEGLWLAILRRVAEGQVCDGAQGLAERSNSVAGLKSALKAVSMALWEWQPLTDQASWSPLLYDFLELPRAGSVESGARFLSFIHPDDKELVTGLLQRLGQMGELDPVKFRIITAKGAVRWLISCAQGHRDASGELVLVTGVNVDITAQEESNARLEAAWREADRRAGMLQAVMEHVPIGIALSLAGAQEVNLVSRAGNEMIGTAGDQSRSWDAWAVYHPNSQTPARKEEMALHRATQGQVVRDEEWLLRAANGRLIPVRCHAGPVYDRQGGLLGGVVAWYDVTPFKQAEAQRLQALEAESAARRHAESASAAKDVFLATLSHELRTPLHAITTWAEVLLSGKADEAAFRRGLESIRRNTAVQARLMDDLLDVSRIIAGKLEVSLSPMDLSDAAALAIETVRGMAESKSIALQSDTIPGLMILGDALRLQQVTWNLISNAIKFSPTGTKITVSTTREGGNAVLRVQDQGPGIPEDMLKRVFERFKQLNAPGQAGHRTGLGLGLTIAQHIVERHGGSIRAESEGMGRGATFIATIPMM